MAIDTNSQISFLSVEKKFLHHQNTMVAVTLTDISYHKWIFNWTNLSLETARTQLGHICLPLRQLSSQLGASSKQERQEMWERAFLCNCYGKNRDASTHSTQNNPTALQRSESAVTPHSPIPFVGLVSPSWAVVGREQSCTSNSGAFTTLTTQSPSWDFFETHAPLSAISVSHQVPDTNKSESQRGLGWKGWQVMSASNPSASDGVANQ